MEKPVFNPEQHSNDWVSQRMEMWAARHELRSDGLFQLSGSEAYKNLDEAHYGWELSDKNKLLQIVAHQKIKKGLLKLGDEMFPNGGFRTMVDELSHKKELLADIRALKRDNKTVLVASDHPWLMNGAVAEAAFYIAMDDYRIAHNSGIIVNKMTGWLDVVMGEDSQGKARKFPVIGTLRKFSEVYCCIPRSDTVDELGLNDFGDSYNKKMIRPVLTQSKKGMILHANPSGSLDLLDIGEHGERSITMQTVQNTTARVLTKHTAAAVSVVMWKERQEGTGNETLSFHIANELTAVNDVSDIHKIMKDMEAPYHELVSRATRSDKVRVQYRQPLAA